ncbi:MAG: MFS transporter [Solobacterium sp.]|nr:MFS transporter [Solobacterium sp.]
MKRNSSQISYGALHFFYWASNATICSFCSAFLLPMGFSSFEIGLIISLGNGGAVLLQPLLAEYADNTKKHNVSEILSWICGVFLILAGLLLVLRGHSLFLAVFYTMAYIVQVCMLPLLNELNYRLEREGFSMNYGAARAMGSLGYSLMSSLAGFAAERYGIITFPALTVLVILLILGILFYLSRILKGHGFPFEKQKEEKKAENLLAFVKAHQKMAMVSLGGLCFMFCSTITGNYLLQIVSEVGGTAKEMGFGLSLAAIMEIPVIFFYDRLRGKFSVRQLLCASGIGYIIKHLILLAAGNYQMILFSQALQIVSFALYLPSSVAYAHENTEEEDSVKGQALMTTAGTAAGLLAGLFGGLVIDGLGIDALLVICVVMSVLGSALIFVFTKENSHEPGRKETV